MFKQVLSVLACVLLLAAAPMQVRADSPRFVLAAATSADNSGLLEAIVSEFTEATGIDVDIVAVGSGQAFEMARRGDAAAILVHDPAGEETFIAARYGTDRRDVMRNRFVMLGPDDDPAGLGGAADMADALARIRNTQSVFVSRGDDSGTHRQELRLWAQLELDPSDFDSWYREAGAGMGRTIMTATQMGAYTLSDSATWARFAARGSHRVVFDLAPPLANPYASILAAHRGIPPAEQSAARHWHEWLTSEAGRAAINAYRIDGEPAFIAAEPGGSG